MFLQQGWGFSCVVARLYLELWGSDMRNCDLWLVFVGSISWLARQRACLLLVCLLTECPCWAAGPWPHSEPDKIWRRALNAEDFKVAPLLVIFAGSCMQFIFLCTGSSSHFGWFPFLVTCVAYSLRILFMFFLSAAWNWIHCKNLPFDCQAAFRRTSTVVSSPFLLVARLCSLRNPFEAFETQVRLWLVCMVIGI